MRATPTHPQEALRQSWDQPRRTVLLVDDDRSHVLAVRNALAPHGYHFAEAFDGPQALSAVREKKPDLILMDVEMPGLGGVEVCRIIKANGGQDGFGFIPVILMSGRQATSKAEGLELGADDYVVKPFDMQELSARVKSMLRLKALQDALVEKNRQLEEANQELALRREELIALTRTDSLTGLSNRRHFEERFHMEFTRSRRYRAPLSLLMMDVDHFKQVNDRYGHPFGDAVLRAVALAARGTLRDVDLLARYGGEELVALLPEAGLPEALRVAERVRQSVEQLSLTWKGPTPPPSRVPCTLSIGVASYPSPGLDNPEALLRAVDSCLYAAKKEGRNQVRAYDD